MRILVVKRDKIGDLLLTTPMLRHLKAAVPQAEVHLLATDYNAWVVAANTDVDRRWIYRRVRGFDPAAAFGALLLRGRLRRERFDWVLVGNGDESPRAIGWGLAAGGARTVACCADRSRYPRLSDPLPVRGELHEVDRLLALLAPMGIHPPAQPAWPAYSLPESGAAFAARWLAERRLVAGGYIVLGLGARRRKKQPSAEQVLRWSARIKREWGLDTVFMWTPGRSDDRRYPGDDETAQPVLDARSPDIHPFRGPLPEALGLIWSARTSLFPDSGLMHFAAASPGGVLGFFAEADVSPSPVQWAPRGRKAEWLEAEKAVADLPDERVFERLARLMGPSARTTPG